MNPYILMPQPMQDVSGLQPVFQNTGQQLANQQAALAEQNQLANQAGQPQSNSGINQLALAMMLRKGKSDPYSNATAAMNKYGAGNVYGYGGQGVVPTTTTGEN